LALSVGVDSVRGGNEPTNRKEAAVTTLPDRPETALLVIDVQNDVVANAYNRDGVIANIAALVDKARAAHAPVVWVQHSDDDIVEGSEGWKYVPELTQEASEPVVHKRYGDSFDDTNLEAVLAARKVGHVIIAGASTDACIRSTLHGAIVRGYDATLVADAHTTEDLSQWGAPTPDKVIEHTNLYWRYHTAPGRNADTVSTDSVKLGGVD
jgi:isochorismate hydrolase